MVELKAVVTKYN